MNQYHKSKSKIQELKIKVQFTNTQTAHVLNRNREQTNTIQTLLNLVAAFVVAVESKDWIGSNEILNKHNSVSEIHNMKSPKPKRKYNLKCKNKGMFGLLKILGGSPDSGFFSTQSRNT